MSEDVKLSTFSTNADFAAELETHAFTSLLKSLSSDFVQLAISNKNVCSLLLRKGVAISAEKGVFSLGDCGSKYSACTFIL